MVRFSFTTGKPLQQDWQNEKHHWLFKTGTLWFWRPRINVTKYCTGCDSLHCHDYLNGQILHFFLPACHVQPGGGGVLDPLYSTHRDAYKALPHPPLGKSDHNSVLLIPAYKQKLTQYGSGQMTRMLHYRTVLLALTGICSGIHPMALRKTPRQSLAASISASTTSCPQ